MIRLKIDYFQISINSYRFDFLGKDIDLKSLYIPKSSSANSPALPMNDNTTPTANPLSTSRPFNQSVRVPPTALPVQQSASGTLKSTKSHGDSRRGKFNKPILIFHNLYHFS